MGARNRVGIGLSNRPARQHLGGIDSLESIPGLPKSLKIRAQVIQTHFRGQLLCGLNGLYSISTYYAIFEQFYGLEYRRQKIMYTGHLLYNLHVQ
jgi:hypothetical protein